MKEQLEIAETALARIVKFLKSKDISFTVKHGDGRNNSTNDEKTILELISVFSLSDEYFLANGLTIKSSAIRCWYDFAIEKKWVNTEEGEFFIPVNLKITTTKRADNLSCKLAIYYVVTGLIPAFPNECSWNFFSEKLAGALKKGKETSKRAENKKDYYFLIVNKSKKGDIFWSSLKTIKTLVANGNNLPFQCCWGKNRGRVVRTQAAAEKFILAKLVTSMKTRRAATEAFLKHFSKGTRTKEKANA